MNLLKNLLFFSALAVPAWANSVQITSYNVTPVGLNFQYDYYPFLSAGSTLDSTSPGQLNIYDFDGYVSLLVMPANWALTTPNSGPIPVGTAPIDSPLIPNLAFQYIGAPINGGATGTSLGTFSILSSFGPLNGNYTGKDRRTSDGSIQGNYGQLPLGVPSSVPEPASFLIAGAGLVGLAMIRRNRGKQKA